MQDIAYSWWETCLFGQIEKPLCAKTQENLRHMSDTHADTCVDTPKFAGKCKQFVVNHYFFALIYPAEISSGRLSATILTIFWIQLFPYLLTTVSFPEWHLPNFSSVWSSLGPSVPKTWK
jgi:hypothetical protein